MFGFNSTANICHHAIYNGKAKAALGAKPRMLGADEVEAITGHPVGGVCPFGLTAPLAIYCDISLQAFDTVFPAAGSRTTSVELTPDRLATLTGGQWIDICTLPVPARRVGED